MRSANKYSLSVAIAVFLLLAASPVLADNVELQVQTSTEANGNITAEVVLDGSLTVSGIQFALTYDESKLQLSSWQDGDLTGSTVNDTESGKIALVWYSVDGVPVSGESSVLRLTFTPKSGGDANISFDPQSLSTMVVDSSLATVATQADGATVSVKSTGEAPSSYVSSNFPVITASPASPEPTPMHYDPTPRPPEKDDMLKPTVSPNTGATAPNITPSASPTEDYGQAISATEQPAGASPIVVQDYDPPQLANTPVSDATLQSDPLIEVIHTSGKAHSYTWLWIIGGIVLIAAGYLAYIRIKKQ